MVTGTVNWFTHQVRQGLACGCVCVECGGRLVAKGGPRTRPHFAHHSSDRHCDGETLLHRLAKRLLTQRIKTGITTGRSVNVEWGCPRCEREHKSDLVRGAASAAVEHTIRTAQRTIRPDVTVLDACDEPLTLIEVIVSHSPDKPVYDFAHANGIGLVEFQISAGEEVAALEHSRILRPARATLRCLTPSCSTCAHPIANEPVRYSLHVVTAPCWKCGRDMKLALWETEGGELHDYLGGDVFGPSGLRYGITVEDGEGPDTAELSLARTHGVVIKRQYSRTMGESYLANTCTACGSFVGANHERDYADLLSPSTRIATYSRCEHCGCGTCDCTGLKTPPARTQANTRPRSHPPQRSITRIRCGHCKDSHPTTEEVRACSLAHAPPGRTKSGNAGGAL